MNKIIEGPHVGEPVPVDEIDLSQRPGVAEWIPRWLIACGKGGEVGITIDDHCLVVLAKTWAGQWKPTSHIPWQAAVKVGELARTEL